MENSEQLTELFKALAHPARLDILGILRDGEQCVCHMEAHLGLRQAYISQQLAVLREAGLIEDRRDGWNVFYRVIDRRVYEVIDQARVMVGMVATKHEDSSRMAVDCPCPKCAAKAAAAPVPVDEIGMRRAIAPR